MKIIKKYKPHCNDKNIFFHSIQITIQIKETTIIPLIAQVYVFVLLRKFNGVTLDKRNIQTCYKLQEYQEEQRRKRKTKMGRK